MTTQDQEPTNTPEATPAAARRRFSLRGFTSLLLTLSSLVMLISGILLFLTPRGRVAHWTDWTLLGLGKEEWGAVHIMNSILFVSIAGLHLYLNWAMFLGYLKKRAVAGLHMKRELAVATVVTTLVVAGAIYSVPPFSSIMALNQEIKDYWEVRAAQAPVAHAEELTLEEFAGQLNLSLLEVTEALQEEGFTVDNSQLTVGEVAQQKGLAPNDVLTAIQLHYPAAGASGGGRGFGGGRGQGSGQGTGRDMGGSGRGENAHSDDQDDAATQTDGTHTDAMEGGHGREMGAGSGGGFGAGQGRGQGGGMGQGRGMGQGQGGGQGMGRGRSEGSEAGPGSADPGSHQGSSVDPAHDQPSGDENAELKGRMIVESGNSITVEGALKQNGHEWQLVSASGIHNIHLGPEEYRETQGVEIAEGLQAVVTGFSVEEDIAVCSITVAGKTYIFRTEDGRPTWAGGGQGRGRNRPAQ